MAARESVVTVIGIGIYGLFLGPVFRLAGLRTNTSPAIGSLMPVRLVAVPVTVIGVGVMMVVAVGLVTLDRLRPFE